MEWTVERLVETARAALGDAKLIVVANREPFVHVFDRRPPVEDDDEPTAPANANGTGIAHANGHSNGNGNGLAIAEAPAEPAALRIRCQRPAGGVVTALDPVMRAVGGTWIGHGSGEADRLTADAHGRLAVPPEKPSYTLRRVWLSKEEEAGYYCGFSNEALWPLCHIAYTRPKFDESDWKHYREVNRKFADAVLEEAAGGPAVVFVQDYHFALLPRMLRDARPDLTVMQFWHIPWPNREAFRVCPWQEEILDGLLGNDLLGFHTRLHANNFLDTVDRVIESKVDMDRSCATRGGKVTKVVAQPISIDPAATPPDAEDERRRRRKLRIGDRAVIIGVDRVDYTKGIPERLAAVERLIERRPDLAGKFCFVQVGAPSRTDIPAYKRLGEEVEARAATINARYGDPAGGWRPVILLREHHSAADVFALYRMSAVCVVSSLHDGMNLVAKEYVAAREDLRGALVLSRFTGAAEELTDALLVNPFATDEFADALAAALTMPEEEQERRMKRMRERVGEYNIFRWSGRLLTEAGQIAEARAAEIKAAEAQAAAAAAMAAAVATAATATATATLNEDDSRIIAGGAIPTAPLLTDAGPLLTRSPLVPVSAPVPVPLPRTPARTAGAV
jgi:trehalose 6-phosphate synthase